MNTTQLLTSIASARNSIRDTLINKGFSLASDAGLIDIATCIQNQDLDFVLNGGTPLILTHSSSNLNDYTRSMAYVINLPNYTANQSFSTWSNLQVVSVNSLGTNQSMFQDCNKLWKFYGNTTQSIPEDTFLNCSSLTGISFPNCTYIGNSAFTSCTSLTMASFPNCSYIGASAFQYCSNLSSIYVATNYSSICQLENSYAFQTTGITSTLGSIIVPANLVRSYKTEVNWNYFKDRIFPDYYIAKLQTEHQSKILINTEYHYTYKVVNTTEVPTVVVEFLNGASSYCACTNLTTTNTQIDFDITCQQEATVDFTVTIADSSFSQIDDFNFKAYIVIPVPYYNVNDVSGASYNFTLNSSQYYESTNKWKNNSAALCKLVFDTCGNHLYLDCINYAETYYDFGILSNLDTTLSTSYTEDTVNVFKSFKGYSTSSVQTVDYGEIASSEHFIYIKFRKDSSQSSNNDSLQFKVRFE